MDADTLVGEMSVDEKSVDELSRNHFQVWLIGYVKLNLSK